MVRTHLMIGFQVTRRKFSLRQRLLLLAGVALAPSVAMLAYDTVVTRQGRVAEVHTAALRLGEYATLELDGLFNGIEMVLQVLSRGVATRGLDPGLCNAFLTAIHQGTAEFLALAIVDRAGTSTCQSARVPAGTRLDGAVSRRAIETNSFQLGLLSEAMPGPDRNLPIAYPVRNMDGAVIGAIVVALDLGWLNARIRDRLFQQNDALTVADREGYIIARHPFPERFVGTRIPEPFLPLVFGASAGSREVLSQDGTRRIIGFHPPRTNATGLYVSAGLGVDAAMRSIDEAQQRKLLIVLLGFGLAAALALFTAEHLIRKPIRGVIETMTRYRAGDGEARTHLVAGRSEISQLGAALDTFLDELAAERTARKASEERRDLLARELQHRVKNTLATVRAIAGQTFRGADEDVLQNFDDRLAALSRAHDRLRLNDWRAASLHDVMADALSPYPAERFTLEGPDVPLSPEASLSLSLAVHELATNAAKYGALKHGSGAIHVGWSLEAGTFLWTWRESDGPPVLPPASEGFGSRMLKRVLASQISGSVALDYLPEGLVCTIRAPVGSLAGEPEPAPPQAGRTIAAAGEPASPAPRLGALNARPA